MKLFVYGGTGGVSALLIEKLLTEGHTVLAGTRHPEKQPKRDRLTWVKVTHDASEAALPALKQVDRAFLMSPPGLVDQYSVLQPWVAAAHSVGLAKVVLMTAMGVEFAPDEAPFRKLELTLGTANIPYNILRPNWFMQNFYTYWIEGILKDRKIYFPGGDARTSFVAAEDIAEVAAALLTGDATHDGQGLAITGPEALTHAEVAEILSTATGKRIEYINVSPEDFKAALLGAGLSADYADFMVMIAGALRDGHAAPITTTVQDVTGRAPTTFAQFAARHREKWL